MAKPKRCRTQPTGRPRQPRLKAGDVAKDECADKDWRMTAVVYGPRVRVYGTYNIGIEFDELIAGRQVYDPRK